MILNTIDDQRGCIDVVSKNCGLIRKQFFPDSFVFEPWPSSFGRVDDVDEYFRQRLRHKDLSLRIAIGVPFCLTSRSNAQAPPPTSTSRGTTIQATHVEQYCGLLHAIAMPAKSLSVYPSGDCLYALVNDDPFGGFVAKGWSRVSL